MPGTIKNQAQALREELVSWRRHLHQHPELSFNEAQTSAWLKMQLEATGLEVQSGIAGHGLCAVINGSSDGPVVALRADMDALPILEETGLPYASTNDGVMHACGHDVHMACLLGAAHILCQNRQDMKGSVKLIFQPAEELLPGGAKAMIEENILENPKVDAVIGQHVYPDLPAGMVAFRKGDYMASSDEVYLEIRGRGGHAALPHKLQDTVLSAAHVLVALQQIVSRKAPADVPTVLSFGRIEGLGATNVIPDTVRIAGTFRTMDEAWRKKAHALIRQCAENTAKGCETVCKVEIKEGYPVLHNDPKLCTAMIDAAQKFAGHDRVAHLDVRMTAEDFAYFGMERPSCFYRLGTGYADGSKAAGLHSDAFSPNEDALVTGAGMMAWLACSFLQDHS